MKVCIIASIFYPYTRGGAEVVAETAALAFKKAGDEVFVITAGPWQGRRSLNPQIEDWQGIKIYRFYPLNIFSFLNIGRHSAPMRLFWHLLDMFNLHTYFVARKILKNKKPDLIMTHNLKGLGYMIPRAIGNWKKWFHTLHDIGALHPTGLKIWKKEKIWLQTNFLVKVYAWANQKLFGSPSAVISSSQFLMDEYINRDFFQQSRQAVIKNPVEIEFNFKKDGRRPDKFLYIGQLEPYKGLRVLFDAWKNFSQTEMTEELDIIGRGSMENEAREISNRLPKVKYLGFTPHEKLGEALAQAKFVVVPSLAYENASMAIIESFACGVPVIASRIGGIPELVFEEKNGFLFEPGNSEDLFLTFKRALQSDWHKLSRNARESYQAHSPSVYVKAIKSLIIF